MKPEGAELQAGAPNDVIEEKGAGAEVEEKEAEL